MEESDEWRDAQVVHSPERAGFWIEERVMS